MRPKGFKHTEETKERIGNANKGKIHSEKTKIKISRAKKGQKINKKQLNALKLGRLFAYTKKAIQKRVDTRKRKNNYQQTLKSKLKISNTLKRKYKLGEIVATFKNKKLSKKHKLNLSLSHKGLHNSLNTEFKKGQTAWNKNKFGEGNPNWQGGKSFEPYSSEFNKELKEKIKKRDNYTCKICNKKQKIKKYAVHHIDYNKKNCNLKNLITLCNSCHIKTNFDRNYWIKYFNGKIIMVSGHRGLICSFLKKRLRDEGYKIIYSIDKRSNFNILNLKNLKLDKPINMFFHFAAACRINQCIAKPIIPHKNNTEGIFQVLEFCRKNKIPKIMFASSSRVLSPQRNPYIASKIYGEEMCKAYHDCYGIDYIIIRPSTVYGPYVDFTSRLINNWLTDSFKGNELRLYGNENKTLDFTYIDDFVDGIMLTLNEKWNKTYNISGYEEVNLLNLAEYIVRKTKSKSQINFYDEEKSQPQQVKVNIDDIRDIGFKPKINIEEGVKRMIKFYKDNPDAWKNYEDKGVKYYGK